MSTTFAIVAAGGMGSSLARRLVENGARVLTAMEDRSAASRERAAAAGMEDVGAGRLGEADIFLSVVPPDQALPLAERMAEALRGAASKPVYVDCNAVGPAQAARIADIASAAGFPFVDAGIIGLPPAPGKPGPTIFLSGPEAWRVAPLADFGIRTHVLPAANGAASALKMSYAGITKGLIAIAASMALASQRAGVGDALVAELQRSQPELFASFTRSVPDMLSKAGRWVPEMHEIAGFTGAIASAPAYDAFAAFYEEIAQEASLRDTLRDFYSLPHSAKQS